MRRRPPPPAPSWRLTLLRHLAVWVGLVCVLGQVSSAVHWLVVEHVRCAQHGEWIHAGEEHATDAAEASASGDEPALLIGGSAESDTHEHCAVGSERRKQAWLPPSTPGPRQPTAQLSPADSVRSASLVSERVYLLAPKTSPPL